MFRSSVVRWSIGFLCYFAAVALVHFKPWTSLPGYKGRESLRVGFLPVT